jgi:integrase
MVRKVFTDALLKGTKPPSAGRVELSDMRCPGLEFRVTPAGSRSFSFRFRDPNSGSVTRSTIGPYPEIGLSDARTEADTLRGKVAKGINPVTEKRRDREDAGSKTFCALSDRYIEEHAKRFKRSAGADERNLRRHILPKWGKRRYDQLERSDVIELVEGIIKDGSPVQANRVHALISTMFSFAVDADLVPANPCSRLRKRGVENRETRVLSDAEIMQFWRRAVVAPVSRRVGLALRLVLLTGCRAGEVAGISRAELHDIQTPAKAAWLVPADRCKNGRAHFVPLSELAVQTINSALELISDEDEFVFPSPVERGGPITGHALTVAMRRLGDKIEGSAAKTWKADPPSPHDLRRTVATRLSKSGVAAEDVSAVLNHVRSDVTGKHYDHYQRAVEKRRALCTWATELSAIVGDGA